MIELKRPDLVKRYAFSVVPVQNQYAVFNYYGGKIGENIVVHEVELEGVSNERKNDSKVVAKKITIGKRIL